MTTSIADMNEVVTNITTAAPCDSTEKLLSGWFFFGPLNQARIAVASLFFALSIAENIFLLWSLRQKKSENLIMFSLIISNLVYTSFVMPTDAVWNWTMQWIAGDFMCRICQMLKQFGMFASSIHVVILSLDRVLGVLCPMTRESKRKRQTLIMLLSAWFGSFLCSLPVCWLYSIVSLRSCEGDFFYQCVDLEVTNGADLAFYYFYTMLMSFVLPLIATIIAHILIACEISNMMKNAEEMGSIQSHRNGIQKAQRRTILLKSLIALTFLVSWGPYYGKGIYDWFIKKPTDSPSAASTVMYQMMYLNPTLQPLVFGFFKKKVRDDFFRVFAIFRKCRTPTLSRETRVVQPHRRRSSYNSLLTRSTFTNKKSGRGDSCEVSLTAFLPKGSQTT